EARCHPVEVIGMCTHRHNLGNDGLARPFNTKYFSELLEVLRCRLADGEDGVAEPSHAQLTELIIEKLDAELASKQWHVADDREPYAPLLVLGKLDDGRQKGLGQ